MPDSDARLKTNVHPFRDGLGFVLRLSPVSFEWDAPSEGYGDRVVLGFVAQEVEPVIAERMPPGKRPSMVFNGKEMGGDDRLHLNHHELLAPMVAAIQELVAKVMELQAEVDELRDRLDR